MLDAIGGDETGFLVALAYERAVGGAEPAARVDVVPGAIEDAAFAVWTALMGLCADEIEALIRNLEWVEKAVRGNFRSCVQMAPKESVMSSNIKSERRGLLETAIERRLRKESVMKRKRRKRCALF